jgi:hypothetical protein
MNNITKRLCTAAVLCLLAIAASAQIKVTEFKNDGNDPAATQYPVKDANDSICALIIVKIPLSEVKFQGDTVKTELKEDGSYWVYVPNMTTYLEIIPSKKDKLSPLVVDFSKDYPTDTIKSGRTFNLVIEVPRGEEAPKSSFTASVGFNVLSIMGPSVSIGAMFHNFTIEAGAVYGLNKSKDVYIYDQAGALADGYSYSALRGFLRVGYDFWPAPVLAITPQVGAAFTSLQGSRLSDIAVSGEKVLDGGTAISGTVGVRLMFAPSGKNGTFRVFLTPEYDFAASKDKNFEALSKFDSTIKGWADGLNVNLGLMFYF